MTAFKTTEIEAETETDQSLDRVGWLSPLVKAVVSIALLWLLVRWVGWDNLVAKFAGLESGPLIAALVCLAIQVPLVAERWRSLYGPLATISLKFPPMLRITYVGLFIGQFMPMVAGDIARVAMVRQPGLGLGLAAAGVIVDRVIAVFALCIIGISAALFGGRLVSDDQTRIVLAGFGALIVLGVFGLAVLAPGIARLLERRQALARIGRLVINLHRVIIDLRCMIEVTTLSLIVHMLSICATFFIAAAMRVNLSLLDAALAVPLMLLAAMIPVSFGGWGAREGAAVFILAGAGVAADAALLISVLFGLCIGAVSLPGAILWMGMGRRSPRSGGGNFFKKG